MEPVTSLNPQEMHSQTRILINCYKEVSRKLIKLTKKLSRKLGANKHRWN